MRSVEARVNDVSASETGAVSSCSPVRPGIASSQPPIGRGVFRILICRVTHSLGNTLLVTPLLRELASRFPEAEVVIVTRSVIAEEVFGLFSNVREIIRLPARGLLHPLKFLSCLRRMRAQKYDLVIDPCPRSSTGRLLTAIAVARVKIGFSASRKRWDLTHPISLQAAVTHTGKQPVALLRSALGEKSGSEFPTPSIELSASERAAGIMLLNRVIGNLDRGGDVIVGIFANATGTKLLPAHWWHQFADALTARHPHAVIVEIIPAFARSMLNHRFPEFYSSDVRRLAGVLSGLALFISADCGVMHLACATATPVAAVFSVTDPAEWGPYGPHDSVLDARKNTARELGASVNLPPARPLQ